MDFKTIKKVFPGDEVPKNTVGSINKTATVYGYLTKVGTHNFISTPSLCYNPQKDDIVIGKISHKNADFYKLDLGFACVGYLPVLNFPGATKRNKPELKIDEYVMAKVLNINSVPLLECIKGMGKIDGYIFEMPIYKIKRILNKKMLKVVGNKYDFKVGMGLNGRYWIWNEDPIIVKEIHEMIEGLV